MDDAIKEFISEANESIDMLDRSLVAFEKTPSDPTLLSDIFRVMHSLKGTCGFLGLHRLAKLAHAAENVLDGFRAGDLAPNPNSVSAILRSVDRVKLLLAEIGSHGVESPGNDSALIEELNAIATAGAGAAPLKTAVSGADLLVKIGGVSSVDCAVEIAYGRLRANNALSPLLAGLQEDTLLSALRDTICSALDESQFGHPLSTALRDLGLNPAQIAPALLPELHAGFKELDVAENDIAAILAATRARDVQTPQAADIAAPPVEAFVAPSNTPAQTIRVQVESLEQLMNVASELVLIRNQLLQVLRDQPDSPFSAPLQRLNLVTSELQESVMTTRMQPIGAAWTKFPRLARDLALDLGKKIDLHMEGGETELDRQVLEQIKDPLTHMLRNAADHGLEPPAERLAAGKSEIGIISLKARHEGSHIVIEVSDDGRGLQPEKIRAKAVEKGLISEADAASLSDAKAQQFIFHPGFSTAASVSGVSGRGVGMDVVRTNIEKIGGAIEFASQDKIGTRFTIRIPLTLTIISALIVETCGQRFAMPQSSVLELVGIHAGAERAIEEINGASVLRLRERLLPLISLQRLMGLTNESAATECCVMVVRVGAFTFGIVVDRVFDTEEIVVKPVARLLRDISCYAGSTILGDGAVIMILNPKSIAAQIGLMDTEESADDAKQATRAGREITQMLVVSAGQNSIMATPLALVSRIEELNTGAVEFTEHRAVVQYRGEVMPILTLDGAAPLEAGPTVRPILVFNDVGRSMGLMVDSIVDIVDANLTTTAQSRNESILGNAVIAGRVTDLIDISAYWRRAAAHAGRANGTTNKRILVVEPSFFHCQLLTPLLSLAGYDVHIAEDTRAALQTIEQIGPFDAVIADVALGNDAVETLAGTPLIGLYSDAKALNATPGAYFASFAERFNRQSLLSALEALTDGERNAA